jgi:hypothetical protein
MIIIYGVIQSILLSSHAASFLIRNRNLVAEHSYSRHSDTCQMPGMLYRQPTILS